MSLILDRGTAPGGLRAIAPHAGCVFVGEYMLSLEDFLQLAEYVLTNTDLKEGDPRLAFVARAELAQVVEGYNPGGKRIVFWDREAVNGSN